MLKRSQQPIFVDDVRLESKACTAQTNEEITVPVEVVGSLPCLHIDANLTWRTTTTHKSAKEDKGKVCSHKLKGDGCETACTGTRDTQCVYVPYVLSVSLE